MVKPGTICVVLSLDLSYMWHLHQLDFKIAFMHGTIAKIVYMHQPPCFVDPSWTDYVALVKCSLSSLKQAHRAWYQDFASIIAQIGFVNNSCDLS